MTSYCGAVYICICVYLFQEARLERYCCVYLCSICIYVYLFQVARLERYRCVYLDARLGVVLSADWVAQWEGFELGESVAKGLNRVVISCRTHLDIISIIEMRWRGKKPAKMPSES